MSSLGVGIELTPRLVRGVLLEPSATKFKLLAVRELPCESSDSEALTQALLELRRDLRIKQSVVLGLPSTVAFLTTVQPLIVNLERSQLGIQFELQQHLPFAWDEAVWHYQWLNALTKANKESPPISTQPVPAIAAAMRRSLFEERVKDCYRAGLKLSAITLNSLAMLNAWQWQRAKTPSSMRAFLHVIDGQTAEWVFWTQGVIQVIPIFLPATLLASTPVTTTSTSLSTGKRQSQDKEAQISQAWVETCADAWESLRETIPGKWTSLELLAPLALGPKLAEGLKSCVGIPVEPIDLASLMIADGDLAHRPSVSAAALGLALHQISHTPFSVNLLSEIHEEERFRQQARIAQGIGGVFLIAAIVFGIRGMFESYQQRLVVLKTVEERQRLYSELRQDVRSLLQQQEGFEQRSQQLIRILEQRATITWLLSQISEKLPPEGVWLTKLEFSKEESILEGSPRLISGMLEGSAKSFNDVTQLVEQLKGIPGVTSVKPLSTHVVTQAQAQTQPPNPVGINPLSVSDAQRTRSLSSSGGDKGTSPPLSPTPSTASSSLSTGAAATRDLIGFVIQIQFMLSKISEPSGSH